ncbi:MAG: DUF3048 domain-containing protein [Eubacteriales bacterium]|nr:DUF3048 domain-containing protein [Eubacterium sp.]MDY5494018.1 DUF3048 domain-containing protein [Eubacteriales bacterium]
MKKELKQILLMILTIAIVASFCATAISCGGSGNKQTTEEGGLTLKPSTTDIPSPPETTTSSTSPVSTTTEISETTTEKPIETTKPITPPETGTYINPLTGLKTSVTDPSNKRPVAIVVDNISNAYKNQKGLYQADILYEALVAPGITRYVAIIEDYESVKDICNVRSGRDYHIDIAQGHNAILVCHGGSITNNYNFYQLVISRLGSRYAFVDTKDEYVTGTEEGGKKYGTIQNYKSRSDLLFDTVVNGSALKIMVTGKSSRFAKSGADYTGAPNGFKFGTSSASSSSISAKTVKVQFTMDNNTSTKDVTFTYDSASDKYIRSQLPKEGTNISGEELSFTNVVFLGVEVTQGKGTEEDPRMALIDVTGSGKGYYCYGGKMVAIRWSKTAKGALRLMTESGAELTLSAGNTYIGYLEKDYVGEFPSKGYHAN